MAISFVVLVGFVILVSVILVVNCTHHEGTEKVSLNFTVHAKRTNYEILTVEDQNMGLKKIWENSSTKSRVNSVFTPGGAPPIDPTPL